MKKATNNPKIKEAPPIIKLKQLGKVVTSPILVPSIEATCACISTYWGIPKTNASTLNRMKAISIAAKRSPTWRMPMRYHFLKEANSRPPSIKYFMETKFNGKRKNTNKHRNATTTIPVTIMMTVEAFNSFDKVR